MILYQPIKPSTGEHVGDPGDLPEIFVGLADISLANIGAAIHPCPKGYEDTGYVPVHVDDPAPTDFPLSKVFFEDRLTDEQFVAFDTIRLQVQARPTDWATSTDPALAALRPFVRPMLRYNAADTVNLCDPGLLTTFEGFAQVHPEVFGENPQAEIARILNPVLLPSEKLSGST